jgi:hypothetical protein
MKLLLDNNSRNLALGLVSDQVNREQVFGLVVGDDKRADMAAMFKDDDGYYKLTTGKSTTLLDRDEANTLLLDGLKTFG